MIVEEILEKCGEAEGYVIFVGRLVPSDKDKEKMIKFDYLRQEFPMEDLSRFVSALIEHAKKDFETNMDNIKKLETPEQQ